MANERDYAVIRLEEGKIDVSQVSRMVSGVEGRLDRIVLISGEVIRGKVFKESQELPWADVGGEERAINRFFTC